MVPERTNNVDCASGARRPTTYDAWALANLLTNGQSVDLGRTSERLRLTIANLAGLPPAERPARWTIILELAGPDGDTLVNAVAETDPQASPPEFDPPRRPANLGDIRRVMAKEQWVWEGYIPAARISGIAAAEGVGKTRFGFDLARRIFLGLPWPDGQKPTFPPGTPTLWICADGQQDDLAIAASAAGLPDEAIFFNTYPDDPYGGTEIDEVEAIENLRSNIRVVRPGLNFIDSLTFATGTDICAADKLKKLMTPIRDLSQESGAAIMSMLHVSRDGEALGKRIKGLARTIITLTQPDPDQPQRLRLAVTKSFAKKPPELGITVGDVLEYDHSPPEAPERAGPGRPASARDEAARFVREALAKGKSRLGVELRAEWKKAGGNHMTFNRAVESLIEAGELTEDGGTGQGKQWMLTLVNGHADDLPF